MKAFLRVLCFCLGGALVSSEARAAEPEFAFVGVMKAGQSLQVGLKNSKSGRLGWMKVGETFEGYTIKSFDEPAAILVLVKDGAEIRLTLQLARVGPGTAQIPEPTRRAILNNLRQLASAADQFYLERGVKKTSYDDLVGPTKYVRQIVSVDGEDYRSIQFEWGKPLEVRSAGGATVSYQP